MYIIIIIIMRMQGQAHICVIMHRYGTLYRQVSVSQRVMYTANANKTNITYSVEWSRSDPPDDDESDPPDDDESDDESQ